MSNSTQYIEGRETTLTGEIRRQRFSVGLVSASPCADEAIFDTKYMETKNIWLLFHSYSATDVS